MTVVGWLDFKIQVILQWCTCKQENEVKKRLTFILKVAVYKVALLTDWRDGLTKLMNNFDRYVIKYGDKKIKYEWE